MAQKKKSHAHTIRTISRETRNLLKAVHLLATDPPTKGRSAKGARFDTPKLRLAWRRHYALSKASDAVSTLLRRVPPSMLGNLQILDRDSIITHDAERVVHRYLGPRTDALLSATRRMGSRGLLATYGVRSVTEMDALFQRLRDQARGEVTQRQYEAYSADGETSSTDCWVTNKDGDRARIDCKDAGIAAGIALLVSFFQALGHGFDAPEDNKARTEIASSDCSAIVGQSNSHWISEFHDLMDGPTTDSDENAILKVLNCLPADRVQSVVGSIGVNNLMDEFQGSEFDKLQLRLLECGLLSYGQLDDDATRKLVNELSESTISLLAVDDIVKLCRNLFEGSCGDDDEHAVIRLIDAQHPCKVQDILKNHISWDEFDDNVDGSEWDHLSSTLLTATIMPCDAERTPASTSVSHH